MCKYNEGHRVLYNLDTESSHVYVVRERVLMSDDTQCIYNLELENDPAVQLTNVPESYMTDTIDRNTTTGASAST